MTATRALDHSPTGERDRASVVRDSRVSTEWVVLGNLNERDADAVRAADPHLDQTPQLEPWAPHDPCAARRESLMFSVHISYL